MQTPGVQYVPMFYVAQKLAMTANRYRVLAANPDGTEGALMAFAHQKRMAFKEKVTFFAEEQMTTPVFGFGARQAIDLAAGYDVVDAAGAPLGFFKKEFAASLVRSTFVIEGPGYRGSGTERSQAVAIARRFVDFPFRFHFDFLDAATGHSLFSVDRRASLRDRYVVSVADQRIDWRVAASVTVALDAMMAR
jgi:hypothetical protein